LSIFFALKKQKEIIMKMTKSSFKATVLMFLTGMFFLASCASTPPTQQAAQAPVVKGVERTNIDWKGKSVGTEIPEWVQAIALEEYEKIEAEPRLKDRLAIAVVEKGKNLDLLRSWATNFNVQAQVSRMISTKVQAEFAGILQGDKNSADGAHAFLEEVVATLSKAKISGLRKDRDFWLKVRIYDNDKKTTEDEYDYYLLYSIDKADLQRQIDIALGKIEAKNEKQKELKERATATLKELKAADSDDISSGENK
jgi:hypothetical protein